MRVEEETVADQSILWRRLDQPGHESARLLLQHSYWHLSGTAVFAHNQQPCRLDYLVVCNAGWQTLSGRVTGWVGNESVEIELSVDAARRWRLNGTECPIVASCIDLDLNFSPSTNLLPIRRLGLAIGQEAKVQAAWLRFPSFTPEPLEQLYRRIDVATYRYESAGGRFVTDLQVNAAGFVTHYPNAWQVEAGS
jgi:uncharacterized protein